MNMYLHKEDEWSNFDLIDCKCLHEAAVQQMCGKIIDALAECERFDPGVITELWYNHLEQFTESWHFEAHPQGESSGTEEGVDFDTFMMRGGGKAAKKIKTTNEPEAKDPKQVEKAEAVQPASKPDWREQDK